MQGRVTGCVPAFIMKTSFLRRTLPATLGIIAASCVSISREPSPEPVIKKFLPTTVRISFAERRVCIDSADLLVYDDSGLQKLAEHWHGKDTCFRIRLAEGDYTFVVLANLNGELREESVSRYEYLESLDYRLADEDPDAPLMSGTAYGKSGGDISVSIEPLLCEVEIFSIESRLQNCDSPIRDLCVYLMNVNALAEPLRKTGFRPSRMIDAGWLDMKEILSLRCPGMLYIDLRCDLGRNALHPHRSLYCYPNDPAEAGLGTPWTAVAVEGSVDGERRCWVKELGPLKRAGRTGVDLILED